MKIIVAGEFNNPIYAAAFHRGLKLMGHDALAFDFGKYRPKANNLFTKFWRKFSFYFMVKMSLKRYNKELLDYVSKESPDFVFLYRCPFILPSYVKRMSELTTVFSYHNDDPFSSVPNRWFNRHYREYVKYCHLNYCFRKKNINDLKTRGIINTKILLPYFIQGKNIRLNIKKDIDIAFVGHFENDGRDEVLVKLLESGVKVKLFGGLELWKTSKYFYRLKEIYGGEAYGEAYNKLLNRIKISLVFFSKINHDTYTTRCFEIPMTGSVMLSEYSDDMNKMYPGGKAAVYFRNADEAVDKAKWLLSNEKIIDEIAIESAECLKKLGGSEIDRLESILNDYKELRKGAI